MILGLLTRTEVEAKIKDEPKSFIPKKGGQENALLGDANIVVLVGNRGLGKSVLMLLDAGRDTTNPQFRAVFIRKTLDALDGLITDAHRIYPLLGGRYKIADKKYVFDSGAEIEFTHLENEDADSLELRFKGRNIHGLYIDESDLFSWNVINVIIKSNRGSGIRNRVLMACNPNGKSYMRDLIEWYLDDEGLSISKYRNGRKRYLYTLGSSASEIAWGNSKEEVFEKAEESLERVVKYARQNGFKNATYKDFILSFQCFEGTVFENEELVNDEDTTYLAKMVMGDEEAKARNFFSTWAVVTSSEGFVSSKHMTDCFENEDICADDNQMYMSADVGLLGDDDLVTFIWRGYHVIDCLAVKKIGGDKLPDYFRRLMVEYNIPQENFVYDANGIGNYLKGHFKKSYGFTPNDTSNVMTVDIGNGKKVRQYDKMKSQILHRLGIKMRNCEISFDKSLLDKIFSYGKNVGKEYKFKNIMLNERIAIAIDSDKDGCTCMKNKKQMKELLTKHGSVRGISPNFIEAMAYRMALEKQASNKVDKGFISKLSQLYRR